MAITLLAAMLVGAFVGCARSGLDTELSVEEPLVGALAGSGAPADAGGRGRGDVRVPQGRADAANAIVDAGPDRRDVGVRDASLNRDASDTPPVFRDDCTDETTLFIYVVTSSKNLYRFDPVGGAFHHVGAVSCGGAQTAFSMAVDRAGTAFVSMWESGSSAATLWRVSTVDASCEAIPEYVPGQLAFTIFGMGFATDEGGPEETLYIAGSTHLGSRDGVATLDTNTFEVSYVGVSDLPVTGMELTGSGDGRLFGFFALDTGSGGVAPNHLSEIDKTSGKLIDEMELREVATGTGWAVAHWGGDFYFFTDPGGTARATRYRPGDDSYAVVGTLAGETIVGAGVTTCARLQ